MELNRVIKGDCISIMENLPDESIDMIFADPPYFGNQSRLEIKRTDGHSGGKFSTKKLIGRFQSLYNIKLNLLIIG
jgi:hypothetical protein